MLLVVHTLFYVVHDRRVRRAPGAGAQVDVSVLTPPVGDVDVRERVGEL